jgi:hypothetical protein
MAAGPDEQPVILSRCFPSRETTGYTHLADRRVLSVNGHSVLNLPQMHALVRRLHHEDDYIAFEMACTGGNAAVITSTATAEETLAHTMRLYRIPTSASAELLE